MPKRCLASILVLLGDLVAGVCAAEGPYIYRPVHTTAAMSGLPAARYPIPRDKPSGDILVASSGLTAITVGETPPRAIFVRVILTNASDDSPWSLDTRKQSAVVKGQQANAAL